MLLTRKRKTKNPCPVCRLHLDLCLCNHIQKLDLQTKIFLIIHSKELRRTTNTGSLAIQALLNSEIQIRGIKNTPIDFSLLENKTYFPLFLFPSDDACELNQKLVSSIKKPILLIVPDGNWRQASKVHTRYPELKNIQRVRLSRKNISQLHLRKESIDHGMATLQAIAYALGIIEGQDIEDKLLDLYNLKLQRTLVGRGKLKK